MVREVYFLYQTQFTTKEHRPNMRYRKKKVKYLFWLQYAKQEESMHLCTMNEVIWET